MITQINESGINLLIIEDDEDYAQYTKIILNRVSSSYEIDIVHAIKPAIELLARKDIDVVLCDLGLPDGQGLENVRKLKMANNDMPILLLTNLDNDELGIQAINEGASDYISKKNVAPELLHRMIIHAIERNKILLQLEDQKSQLLRMQKMEALVTLVGGISHDFNNIITLIKGYAELIESHPEAPPPVLKYNNQILEASNRAGDLIEQLSTFSREETRKADTLDVNKQINSLSDFISSIVTEEINLVYNLSEESALTSINSTSFEQIILNLVLNAREAIDGTGEIVITTETDVYCNDCNIVDPCVKITITDTGEGIPQEVLPNIFDPYFTTKAQGSGLGLATVFGLVNQVGGCINVDSEPGNGTKMEICFIRSDYHDLDNVEIVRNGTAQLDHSVKNILVVDDDEEILELLSSMLDSHDFSITVLNDPVKALEKIFSAEISPSVILTDVIMPKMSGIQLAHKIQDKFPDIPIVLMSGYSPQYYETQEAQQLELIRKPFNKQQLIESLTKAINHRH